MHVQSSSAYGLNLHNADADVAIARESSPSGSRREVTHMHPFVTRERVCAATN